MTAILPASRVVAITGAGRGIGKATAEILVGAGARVALGDIDEAAAQAVAQELGPAAVATRLDVSDNASFAAFVAFAERELGPLDVLINNAGIMPIGPFLDETHTTAERVLSINVLGCLIGMKSALPGMLERGRGHIVNVASIAGKSPVPGGLTYAASKAAVISATETARVEYTGRGLEFTCVMPSFTNTDLISGTKGTRGIKNVEPEDVGEAILAALARPRPDVYVPKAVGAVARVQPLMGRRLRDAANHALKADRTFLEIDHDARADYDRRVGAAPARDELPAGSDGPPQP
jgi:NAD(P)-dependent dehydrogenase (short-subunit alcohol dehydrogenase family)